LSEESLTLNERQREKLVVLRMRASGRIDGKAAAGRLGLGERQVRRLVEELKGERGDSIAVHGLSGQPSNNRFRERVRRRIVELHRTKYADYEPTLFTEKLAEKHGIRASRETVRQILIRGGTWRVRRGAGKKRHEWRERRACFGELVQLDGSDHDWFEGRGPRSTLILAIDDATSTAFGLFAPEETIFGIFEVMRSWVTTHGLPGGFYVDRAQHFFEEDEDGRLHSETTQIGRAMNELEIKLIGAWSPQAKGRVENKFKTLQDRLVKELRERGIRTLEEANRFLVEEFWVKHNQKFAKAPRARNDAHRPLGNGLRASLDAIFSIREKRAIQRDHTIRFEGRRLLVLAPGQRALRKGAKVEVCKDAEGRIQLRLNGRDVGHREVSEAERTAPAPPKAAREAKPSLAASPWKPPATHPWRKSSTPRASPTGPLAASR
jgi:hypothetical protein